MPALELRRLRALRSRRVVIGLLFLGFGALMLNPVGGKAATAYSAVYVSTSLAGGEPFVIYSHAGSDLVYSGHEGTTHLYNGSGAPVPGDTCDIHTAQGFVCSYNNQVNNWYSTDGGVTWTKSPGNPLYTGFSDPSLTEDAAGANPPLVYNTGIDLVNDALFASQDGGKTWIAGTPQCHDGDRPWLAGGKNGEVFMGTDGNLNGHLVVKGTVTFVAGVATTITCSTTTIPDPAATTASGIGDQLYYDHNAAAGPNGLLVEPARFNAGDPAGCPSGTGVCVGISVLPNASTADFTSMTSTSHFVSRPFPVLTSFNDALGPRIIIGPDDTIYEVWATFPTSSTGTNNCGGPTPLPNQVLMAYTKDQGVTWSSTKVIATMNNAVAWWPWVAAGPDNASVVWYQSNQVTDPDCDSAHSVGGAPSTQWTAQVANIYGATTTATYPPASTSAVPNFDNLHPGGIIHVGAICQNGTTCALNTQAGNEDRRLGDYFTNALDQNGCVMIATADTQLSDSTPVVGGGGFRTGRPLFVHQISGPSLTTGLDCATFAPNIPEAPALTALIGTGAVAIGAVVLFTRRRRTAAV